MVYFALLLLCSTLFIVASSPPRVLVLDDLRDFTSPESKAFISSLRNSLLSHGYAHIPNFVNPSTFEAEARSLLPSSFRSTQTHTIFQEDVDPSLAPSHIRNLHVKSSKLIVDAAKLPPSSPLSSLYRRPEFLDLIRRVVGAKELHLSADEYNGCYYNVYTAGDGLGWHFDNSLFGVNLILSSPEGGGGDFEIDAEKTRGEGYDDDDDYAVVYSNVADAVGGRRKTRKPNLEPGVLCIFAGRDSIHRVTPVEGGERVNAIFTFEKEKGVKMGEYGLKKFFGRGNENR